MGKLPIQNGAAPSVAILQTTWAKELNPLLASLFTQGVTLQSVSLSSGANVVNHTLGHKLNGWLVVRQRAAATFFDTQDLNPTPAVTLNLNASAAVVVDLYVF